MFFNCSKDSLKQSKMGYFPKTIDLEYNTEQTVLYKLFYTTKNLLSQINIERSSDGENTRIVYDFQYNDQGLLKDVQITDETDNIPLKVSFAYDVNGIIDDIDFVSSGTEIETSIFYNSAVNSYTVDGEFGNLPTTWNFDSKNHLKDININGNVFGLDLDEASKGVFYDVPMQPAHHICSGLLFYLFSYELYYFSPSKIVKVITNEKPFLYQNNVRDDNGNLIFFQINYSDEQFIGYNISYENRSL
tara:strand:- start:574 stop:1311 length:738 start_codon:yes stop_codon:yes gene_type:complete